MHRLWRITAAGTASAALLTLATNVQADVVETRELEETIPVSRGEPLVVIVKNIIGSIRVSGHDADRVEMRATETVRGDLQADIGRAREALQLRTESEPGRVAIRVRHVGEDPDCNCDRRGWGWGWGWDDSYSVEYDIEVRVPRGATLDVATVNDGDVTVEDVDGEFEVANVNGAVRLVRAGGSGTVHTVNGDVDASFARTPSESTSFRTVNGEVDVTFPANLSAELAFNTMHGDVFTDFDIESLSQPADARRDRGRFVLNTNRASAFRVGAGGERHSFNTLNGDILVRKATP
jgi:Putative adhesin